MYAKQVKIDSINKKLKNLYSLSKFSMHDINPLLMLHKQKHHLNRFNFILNKKCY